MTTKTISRTEILRAVVRAYPDGEVLVGEIDKMDDHAIYKQACEYIGDSLLQFVIIELYEGLDGDLSIERALQLIERGVEDLHTAKRAIERMEE